MSIFIQLGSLYSDIDNQFAILEYDSRIKRYTRKEREIQNKRRENDQAYFLYMFTRFEDRVALLTPIGQTDYNLIQNYYRQRNSIAHGQSFTITIDIMTVIEDLKRLYNDLKAI